MPNTHQERHPFLDDLANDAELISSVLRGPVVGRDEIRRVVDAVGTFYAKQTPTFMEIVGSRTLLEYEAILTSGERLNAAVIIDRDPDGFIPRVSVRMAPVDAVVSLAGHLKSALSGQLPEQLFL
ncbi:hypothetical protein FHS26_004745 [Rhizobium pisi]|uniref:Nuclear transport factor 2 family protein n=1 Tax=Rhizobium pisi TaxID=574561 RepID=A0A3R9B174_9HYPH|nr:hypothetical protein [Rhizobium pisi]MBB3136987.1 hypothetical protein [Rhizobium pisi]RSB66808.1 hypothetical protein EFD55_23065 [Rhizobium pisi]TCA50559.1 hypothetical protein E0J16_22275 [Rhizobium pisi]